MKRVNKSVLILGIAALGNYNRVVARNVLDVELNARARESCHILRFPLGWQMPQTVSRGDGSIFVPPRLRLSDDYEFRVPGLQGTSFLVRGVERIIDKYYTTNIYEADSADAKGIARPASQEAWKSAAAVSVRHDTPAEGGRPFDSKVNYIELDGRRFMRSGDGWGAMRLSLDRAILVLESWGGTLGRCGGSDVPGTVFNGCIDILGSHGKICFDVYNMETGKKLITLTANFNQILPEEGFKGTGWVTERYFIVPLDEKREQCLICDFGREITRRRP